MANSISRQTFEEMPDGDKLNVLFDLLKGLEKRKKFDSVCSAIMGVCGGAAAVFAKMTIWK